MGIGERDLRPGRSECWVYRNCAVQQGDGLFVVSLSVAVGVGSTAQIVIICLRVDRTFPPKAHLLLRRQPDSDLLNHLSRHFTLESEDVALFAFISAIPQFLLRRRADQLRSYAHTIPRTQGRAG